MPGQNPSQASVPAQTDLMVALKSYIEAAQVLQRDTHALISEVARRNFKRPAVFKSGCNVDMVAHYQLASIGPASDAWNNWILGVIGSANVMVFNIQDADIVRISSLTVDIGNNFLAYALSPLDLRTQIPVDQFSLATKLYSFSSNSLTGFTGELDFSGSGPIPTTGTIDPVTGAVNEQTDITEVGTEIDLSTKSDNIPDLIQISEEIPCAGNNYLHVFGYCGEDLFDVLTESTGALLTYSLIK